MFSRLFRDRLGLTLVVVVSGLATALVMGNRLLAASVAIGVVLLGVALKGRSRGDDSSNSDDARGNGGKCYSFSFTSVSGAKPDLEEVALALGGLGLSPRSDPRSGAMVLEGGSQLRTRLLGGYFIDPKHLPIRAELEVKNGNPEGRYNLELRVSDTLGMAVRDGGLEARYRQAASGIQEVVESALKA